MITTTFRQPMDLPQLDNMSCYTNVVAQARWMLELSDTTGLDAVREVDRLSGRPSGVAAEVQPQLLMLLQEGCELVSFHDFDFDELVARRANYIREKTGHAWGPDHESRWTERAVDDYIELCRVYKRRYDDQFGPYLRRLTDHSRAPTVGDVESLLADGYLVMPIFRSTAANGHAVLVCGDRGSEFDIYWPGDLDCLFSQPKRVFEQFFDPGQPMAAVRL